jgi:hypothetical protein
MTLKTVKVKTSEVMTDGETSASGEVLAWQARAHAAGGAELARRDLEMHAP